MSISTLSTLSLTVFSGAAKIYSRGTAGLAARLNTVINKVNEVIAGMETLDTLTVAYSAGYYLANHAMMVCDGVNPPTFVKIRVQDSVTGQFYDCYPSSGTWGIHAV